jgi:cell division protease FtsH
VDKQRQLHLWYLLLALIAVVWVRDIWVGSTAVQTVAYSELQQYLRNGQVESVQVSDQLVRATLKQPTADGRTRIVAIRVAPDLARDLAQYNVRFEGVIEGTLLRDLLSWVLPALVFFFLWYFVARRLTQQGGGLGGLLSIGRSKARVYAETGVRVTFDDVAGVDEAKEELRESVEFLKDPKAYGRLGAHMPKGILLVGPPGTGKTLLARAVAGEAGVPFLSINGSEFVELFVGVGAARVRDLFEQARKQAPAIIFIDELDALGRARGIGPLSGGHDEKEQTLNQLLAEMDGFDTSAGVVILAATNRPEILDPALLRAGRFDRQVLVDRPDRAGRVDILKVHLKKIQLAPEVDPDAIAALTPGFAGADLANLVNEAALLATRRKAEAVAAVDFTSAIERIVAGLEKHKRLLSPHEREVVAYHEMGHALVTMALPGIDTVHKVSIIPRGVGALGYTIQRPTEERFISTHVELETRMAVLMGGRAAEALVFGEMSTGGADDLVKVTDIALDMVARFGMDREVGQVVHERTVSPFLEQPSRWSGERNYSEETARRIDAGVRSLVDAAFARASAVLTARRALLERGARLLLEKETLVEADLAPFATEAKESADVAR